MTFQEQLDTLNMMEKKIATLQEQVALLQKQKNKEELNLLSQVEYERKSWELFGNKHVLTTQHFTNNYKRVNKEVIKCS